MNRISDLAGLLVGAYEEYRAQKRVLQSIQDAVQLLKGYESGLMAKSGVHLTDLFPSHFHLDMHIVVQVWRQRMADLEAGKTIADRKTLFDFSYHLLKDRPFEKLAAAIFRKGKA